MEIKVFQTAQGQPPMQEVKGHVAVLDTGEEWPVINLMPEITYQEIKGFGGAFTEAAAVTVDKLSKEKRGEIIKLYFDKEEGIGYNFGRVHMNSCDFSLGNYSCVDENDETLDTFQINRDKQSMIPMIQDAQKYGDIDLLVSPWSPPAYMKTTGRMNEGGSLLPEYRELWAKFYEKFITCYREEGIPVWGVTVQNEPKAVQRWDSCVYTAEEERDFVRDYLGEKMKDMGVKLFFWDHNKERIYDRSKVMMEDEKAKSLVDGVAFHWYSGDHFEQLALFSQLYPDKELMFTEGCYEYSLGAMDTVKIGEKYAHDMIGNFNNGCNIFCDWNLVLDEKGGPNHVGNYCDAPIMVDTQKGNYYVRDSYYYIGHFSKFIQKGAKRIANSKWTPDLDVAAFKNPDGEIVTVVLNASDEDKRFFFRMDGQQVETTVKAHSIRTYLFE
ncbi:MAG: glucosylceramidase [Clostridia bacterium]|nr:glucosylceramidase [Clostridia bacterium]